jgi:hypothetical integral membrane protein (TIGR02206 family)
MTIVAALTVKPWSGEIAYFTALGGSSMGLITPDLWAPCLSYPSIYFFLSHGGIVTTVLFLVWAKIVRPRPGCVWRVFFRVNGFTLCVGLFNTVFDTNYMYLCRKPSSASLADYLGPWPVYIVAAEVLVLGALALLWLPFSIGARRRHASTVQ